MVIYFDPIFSIIITSPANNLTVVDVRVKKVDLPNIYLEKFFIKSIEVLFNFIHMWSYFTTSIFMLFIIKYSEWFEVFYLFCLCMVAK